MEYSMITIGIIDDERSALKLLKAYVAKHLEALDKGYNIYIFQSGTEAMEQSGKIDILFLDIEMPEMDGIQCGRQIRRRNPDCILIMATGHVERFKEAFKINAFRYITKPYDDEEIAEALNASILLITGAQTIEVYHDRMPYQIMERDICYIRAYNSYTLIITDNMEFRSELSLKEFETQLDNKIFFRIDRSHLVNLLKIRKGKDGGFYLVGEPLNISRRRKKEFQEKYIKADTTFR